ncbi:MAG: hypothetical protein Q4Q58_01725 [Thermoplasmata archaeon]|nr:hypothetical protein [Thermoplasmata archaeon]
MADSKANVLGIIGLIGAILLIVGVFLTWAEASFDIVIYSASESYTGWDIYSEGMDAEYNYAPLVALIAGVVAIITTIIPIVLKNATANRLLGVITLILAVVAIVLMVLFYGQMETLEISGYTVASVTAGYGLWVSIAGAVILALGGIVDIVKKYNTAGDA